MDRVAQGVDRVVSIAVFGLDAVRPYVPAIGEELSPTNEPLGPGRNRGQDDAHVEQVLSAPPANTGQAEVGKAREAPLALVLALPALGSSHLRGDIGVALGGLALEFA